MVCFTFMVLAYALLIIVKPETVIRWHRQGFKLYWRWKSKAPVGRPKIDKEIRGLIKRMSLENPLWGTPRIQSELRLLGFDLAESTVAKYRVRGSASPSQTWKTFLANHAKQIAASILLANYKSSHINSFQSEYPCRTANRPSVPSRTSRD
jgi:hypothetical protein